MTCRAPNSGTVCGGGSPTGAPLGYDIQGQLATWQNAPTSPTTTATYLYDGEGQRAEQQVTASGTTTTTLYLSNLEEVAITGGTTTNTAYFYANGQRIALAVNGAISYLGSDGLGSATTTLDSSGNAQASELYLPYGGGRYTSGTMPTRRLFTGQVSDAATSGLDYYNARYYDPALGQFVSPDPAGDGLDLYAYVKNDPTTLTDPTGKNTYGICAGGTGVFSGLGGIIQGCVVIGYDPNTGWSAGLEGTGAAATVTAGAEAGVSPIGFQYSTVPTVDDLNGPFLVAGGSGSILEYGATGSVFAPIGKKGRQYWGFDVGYQPGAGAEFHGGVSNTRVVDLSTVAHLANREAHQAVDSVRGGAHQEVGAVDSGLHWLIGERITSVGPIGVGTWLDQQTDNAAQSVNSGIDNASSWTNQQIDNASNAVKGRFSWAGW